MFAGSSDIIDKKIAPNILHYKSGPIDLFGPMKFGTIAFSSSKRHDRLQDSNSSHLKQLCGSNLCEIGVIAPLWMNLLHQHHPSVCMMFVNVFVLYILFFLPTARSNLAESKNSSFTSRTARVTM